MMEESGKEILPVPELRIESDPERLRYFEKRILGACTREGGPPGAYGSPQKFEAFWERCALGIQGLKLELEADDRFREFVPEVDAVIDSVRHALLQKRVKPYRNLKTAPYAKPLGPEEVEEQKVLRKDLTEWKSYLRWYVLQNEKDEEYLRQFFATIRSIWGQLGLKEDGAAIEKGLLAELAAYKVLRKNFKAVSPGTPVEDGLHAVDFWAETEKGRRIIFQVKSSSPFHEMGVFDRKAVQTLCEKLEQEGKESFFVLPHLEQAHKLAGDLEIAEQYGKDHGARDTEALLMVIPRQNISEPSGEPVWSQIRKPEDELRRLNGKAALKSR